MGALRLFSSRVLIEVKTAPSSPVRSTRSVAFLRNPGIGLGLVETYLSRHSTTAVAGVCDPNHPSSQELHSLYKNPSSRLLVVKIYSKSAIDPANAVSQIKSQGVNALDLVIANAGICNDLSPFATVDPAVIKKHVDGDGFGPLYLFQATLPLL